VRFLTGVCYSCLVVKLTSAPTSDQEDVIEQLEYGSDQPGHVGQCGGIENGINAADLLLGVDDAGLLEQLLRAGGSVEFHRQGRQGK
jgi:hypothetical protein